MASSVRTRKAPRRALIMPTDYKLYTPLPVPDAITFVVGERWSNRRLYPRQATLLKIIFLETDLLTDYDKAVIAEWEHSFLETKQEGITPGIIERMILLKESGYSWFREALLVMGRRGGKGHVAALALSIVLWHYMAKNDPQAFYGVDRDKQLICSIYAGKKEQAKANLWQDLVKIVQGSPCFAPYISKPLGESLSVYAPADVVKISKLIRRGIQPGLDMATFRLDPREATTMSGRGGAAFALGFDEMAHMIATGVNRAADEVWKASTPSLDQFKKDAFIVCPSSPWEMLGQFYDEWKQSQEIDQVTGEPVYPDKMFLQLPSWNIYEDWEIAHEIDLFPEDYQGRLGEYVDELPPRLAPLKLAISEYDEGMRKLELADPDSFAVERMSHWQTTLDAYFDPKKIAEMFDSDLEMTVKGSLNRYYKAHADPSLVNDNFGLAIAHLEKNDEGYDVAVFDYLHFWSPVNFPNHTIDYLQVNKELWKLIRDFPIDDVSFDQHNSAFFIQDLQRQAQAAQLPKRVMIHEETATAPHNLAVAENFKVALNQGWIRAPYLEQADLELRYLQFKNGKVVHQTAGPVVHDDVARAMMEVVWGLLQSQVHKYRMGAEGMGELTGTMIGGMTGLVLPGMTDHDLAVFQQFESLRGAQSGRIGGGRGSRFTGGFAQPPARTPRPRR
jgi:hypothetical protein